MCKGIRHVVFAMPKDNKAEAILATDHLVTVVLHREDAQGGFNDSTTQTQNQM